MKINNNDPIENKEREQDDAIDDVYTKNQEIKKAIMGCIIVVVIIICINTVAVSVKAVVKAWQKVQAVKAEVSLDELEIELKEKYVKEKLNIHNIADENFKKTYPTLEELTTTGGVKIPTFYKYTQYENVTSYEHVNETNEMVTDEFVIKLHYDKISKVDLKIYTNALMQKEGYEEVKKTFNKRIYKREEPREDKKLYTYVIIEKNCITYGIMSEEL